MAASRSRETDMTFWMASSRETKVLGSVQVSPQSALMMAHTSAGAWSRGPRKRLQARSRRSLAKRMVSPSVLRGLPGLGLTSKIMGVPPGYHECHE